MERHALSKSTFIRGTQCLKSLYLNKKQPFLRDRLSDSQRAVFKRGSDVGLLAQQLFPGGVNLSPKSASQFGKKVQETARIIRTNSFQTLYEASFQYDRCLAILDILVKSGNAWIAYEVKSSVKISETYLLDAAFQYYVITNSGVELEDFVLVYINKNYVFDGTLDLEKLFIKQSVLSEVIEKQEFIKEKVKEQKQTLQKSSAPEINIGEWCNDPYPCDFLGYCWRNIQENSILYLDAFEEDERFSAYYSGNDDPGEYEIEVASDKQSVQLWSARNKEVFMDEEKLSQIFDELEDNAIFFSSYFLKPAIPYLADTHPYQAIPVACAIQSRTGNPETTFFISENSAIELFISYFRKILKNSSKLILYDKKELLNFLTEAGYPELLEATEERCIALSQAFQLNALFDYRLKGDYSPQNTAWNFLKKGYPLLDPALLNMNWQIASLAGKTDDELLENTRQHLYHLTDFQHDFMNLLKNPKSIILLQNK